MADTKLLNLDEYGEGDSLTIVLNGNSHKLQEMTVSDFVWAQKELKNQEGSTDEIAVFESLVRMLGRQFPTVPAGEFEALPMSKLRKLMDFVNNISQQGAEKALAEQNAQNPPTAEQAA